MEHPRDVAVVVLVSLMNLCTQCLEIVARIASQKLHPFGPQFALFHIHMPIQPQCGESLVESPRVVQGDGEAPLDSLFLQQVDLPLPRDQRFALERQESEDSGIGREPTLLLKQLRRFPELEEPPALDHQSLDLLALPTLKGGRRVQPQGVEALSSHPQVKGICPEFSVVP